MTHRPTEHQTLATVTLAAAALVGALAGALSSALAVGVWYGSALMGSVWDPAASADVQMARWREEEATTVSVVRRVAPAVVSIVIRKVVTGASEPVEVGGGTGFFVTPDGLLVTNRHVVGDREAIYTIVTNDGAEVPARVVAIDPFLDIALLDVEGDGYASATLGDSDQAHIGQTVIAVGNTLSEFRNTVTKGVVSGLDRYITAGDDVGEISTIERAIQTDAAINLGNSGGPLVNLLGEVIGVNTAVSTEGQSIGFAIPINEVKKAVTDVVRYGRILRPWLGVRYVMVTPALASERSLAAERGAILVQGAGDEPAVLPGSPAETAGFKEGDVLVSVNGEPVGESRSLASLLADFAPGERVRVQILRGEEAQVLEVTLGEVPVERLP